MTEATHFYKQLVTGLALKWDNPYSVTMSWLRCQINFALLLSAIQCFRGARSSIGHATRPVAPVDLVATESHLSMDF